MHNNSKIKVYIVYRISIIFCLFVPDVLKIVSFLQIVAFSTIDLFYNRIILYNRIMSLLLLFIFTAVAFGVFNMIYFCLALKAPDIN